MTDQEIREKLREYADRIIMEMKSEEAYEVKKELDEFIKKYNVTTEQLEEFTDSGAGEMLYMLTCD